jgi:ribosomal protein S27E
LRPNLLERSRSSADSGFVAYLTCPDCMMPSPVGDDAVAFRCTSCFIEVVFETCADCGFRQSIPSRWHTAYTCGKCGAKCLLPRRRMYATSTKAFGVEGYGYTYPRF